MVIPRSDPDLDLVEGEVMAVAEEGGGEQDDDREAGRTTVVMDAEESEEQMVRDRYWRRKTYRNCFACCYLLFTS